MGWIRRLFHRVSRQEAAAHPWVSPRFLSVVAGLAVLGVALGAWALNRESAASGSSSSPVAQSGQSEPLVHQDLVGFGSLSDALDASTHDCLVECQVNKEWMEWTKNHPNVRIVAREPVTDQGIAVAWKVTWEERP